MTIKSKSLAKIFQNCVIDYHQNDDVNFQFTSPFDSGSFEDMLYRKCWIDTVQWHLEDLIRDTSITAESGLLLKRKIDKSNQDRTDLVEKIDDYFLEFFKKVTPKNDAKYNTESLGWAVDRLSILMLKIFHMEVEVKRGSVGSDHYEKCFSKLNILNLQFEYLNQAIDTYINDIETGIRVFKVYRQIKMYNDISLNPVLYSNSSK